MNKIILNAHKTETVNGMLTICSTRTGTVKGLVFFVVFSAEPFITQQTNVLAATKAPSKDMPAERERVSE